MAVVPMWRRHSCLPRRDSSRRFWACHQMRPSESDPCPYSKPSLALWLPAPKHFPNPASGVYLPEVGLGAASKSVETSLDAADKSVCATSTSLGARSMPR